jgi:nucleolar MIF4G domain-containing protein 1
VRRGGSQLIWRRLADFIEDLDRFYPGMFSDTEDEGSEGSDGQSESDDPASDAEMSDVEFPAEDEDQVLASDDSDDDADLADWDAAMASTDESEEDDSAEDDASEPSSSGRASENTARSNPAASASVAATAPPSAPTGRYVPPAARAAAAAAAAASGDVEAVQTAAQQRLRRQAKGLLNRLGDGNIESILGELEALYRDNSRAEVTGALTSLILGTVGARSDLVDTFIILYAALIGALHRVVGVEFAASLLQACVDELLKQHAASLALDEADGESTSKEATNLVALLSAMYNLGVLATPLMYDLMRLFLGVESAGSSPAQMREADVELLLKLVKSCGAQLRHDDPTSLRTIIDAAKERANAAKAAVQTGAAEAGSSRTRFMLEALADLKNNRVKATAAAESSPAGQAISRMKKFLAGLGKKRTLRAHEPLRVGLRDLREAETRGKWWLVGAAWAGHGDADDAEGVTAARPLRSKEDDGAQQALLAAARAQGMNTEARRNIFVVLMSSEDYADASNRLLSLKLNDTQRREIVRVLLHCVGGVSCAASRLAMHWLTLHAPCRKPRTIPTTRSSAHNSQPTPRARASRCSSVCGTFCARWASGRSEDAASSSVKRTCRTPRSLTPTRSARRPTSLAPTDGGLQRARSASMPSR